MKLKRDESMIGRHRFIHRKLNGQSGGFDKEIKYGEVNLYIDRYERTFSLSDGDLILTVPLGQVVNIIGNIGET